MTTARRNKLTRYALAVLVICALTALCIPALGAQADPIELSIEATGTELTAPGDISVSLRVANTGDTDMRDPVTLYDPAGNVVSSFGENGSIVLGAGKYLSWSGTYAVTESDLDAGKVVYTIKYNLEDADGNIAECTQQGEVALTYTGERVKLSVNRTITPEVCRTGKTVSVIYELVNSGNVKLTSIKLSERLTGKTQTVDTLAPGDKKTLTFTTKMGTEDLFSGASITYKAEGQTETGKQSVDSVTIPLAKPNLSVSLACTTAGVNVGETAVLQMTFVNAGNVSYSNVTVKDAKKGEVFTGVEIPAGATVVKEKEFTLTEPTTFKFTASLNDNTGETKEMSTDEVTVQVYDPEKSILLTLNLTCDHETVSQVPAKVRFSLNVVNNSEIKATNIAITHGATHIYTIASLEPGKSITLDRDVEISQAGQFRFTASAKDGMGNTVSFDSNTLAITYAAPTAAPTAAPIVTVAPLVTVAPPTDADVNPVVSGAKNASLSVAVVLACALGVAFILFVASSVIRAGKRRQSENAYDHLELAGSRDYTEEHEEDSDVVQTEELSQEDVTGDADAPAPAKDEETALPHEKILSDLDDADAPAPEVTAEDVLTAKIKEREPVTDDPYAEAGYRVTRNAPEAKNEEPAQPASEAPDAGETEAPAPNEKASRRRRAARTVKKSEDGEE